MTKWTFFEIVFQPINGTFGVGKERTSVVSTPSLAELYRFAMNFLLVRKRNRDGRKRRK